MASNEVASEETSNPIGKGDKREASSPLDTVGVDSKKIRHQSGDSATSEMAVTETTDFGADGMDEPVHVFTQPVNPTDIVLMARELRSLCFRRSVTSSRASYRTSKLLSKPK